jgi:hypothetical protein
MLIDLSFVYKLPFEMMLEMAVAATTVNVMNPVTEKTLSTSTLHTGGGVTTFREEKRQRRPILTQM